MAIQRDNPIGIQATGQLRLDMDTQVRRLHRRIEEADRAREPWLDKQRKLWESRLGVRRRTNFPWPGAANESWPLVDSVFRRWRPAMIRLVLASDPVAYFSATEPQDLEGAATAQLYYHWKFNEIPDVHKTVFELVDKIGQYGTCFTLQGWEYKTDKAVRLVRSDSLFPGGVEASYNAFVEGLASDAAASGQEAPPAPSPAEFVSAVLQEQYRLDPGVDGDQLAAATQGILAGQPVVRLLYEEVVADRPSWKVLDPLKVIRTPRGTEVSTDDFVAVVHDMTPDALRRMVRDGHLQPGPVEEVLERRGRLMSQDELSFHADRGLSQSSGSREMIQQILDTADGISDAEALSPMKETIWQIFTKLDTDGDGLLERVVLWYHPVSKTLLAANDYVFPFREWPVVEFNFEYTSARPFSARGIPEHLYAHQKIRNRMHNARLDAVAITLSPMFTARTTVGSALRNIRPRPGLIIPVSQVGDIAPLNTDTRPLQFLLQEENVTAQQAEQYIGIFDPSVLAQNTPERRTATEVAAVTGVADTVFSADAILFQRSMAKVHRQLWQLIMEFGPDEEFFRVTGEQVPRTALRADLNRNFDIAPAGTPETTSRAVALQNAGRALELALQDQAGILKLDAVYRHYFDLLDRNLSKLVVRSDQELQLMQALQGALNEATQLR